MIDIATLVTLSAFEATKVLFSSMASRAATNAGRTPMEKEQIRNIEENIVNLHFNQELAMERFVLDKENRIADMKLRTEQFLTNLEQQKNLQDERLHHDALYGMGKHNPFYIYPPTMVRASADHEGKPINVFLNYISPHHGIKNNFAIRSAIHEVLLEELPKLGDEFLSHSVHSKYPIIYRNAPLREIHDRNGSTIMDYQSLVDFLYTETKDSGETFIFIQVDLCSKKLTFRSHAWNFNNPFAPDSSLLINPISIPLDSLGVFKKDNHAQINELLTYSNVLVSLKCVIGYCLDSFCIFDNPEVEHIPFLLKSSGMFVAKEVTPVHIENQMLRYCLWFYRVTLGIPLFKESIIRSLLFTANSFIKLEKLEYATALIEGVLCNKDVLNPEQWRFSPAFVQELNKHSELKQNIEAFSEFIKYFEQLNQTHLRIDVAERQLNHEYEDFIQDML